MLTGAVAVPGHMSASGSRSSTDIRSWSRSPAPQTRYRAFPPPLDCIRTVSAHADPLTAEAPLHCVACAVIVRHAATPISFGVAAVLLLVCACGCLNRNSLPSHHIACMITASLRATATEARL